MAQGGSRRCNRSSIHAPIERPGRCRRLVKPVGWPRYMIAKRLRSGQAAYYWNAKKSDIESGFSLHREASGVDYASAKLRADQLNAHLDAWRVGKGADRSLETSRSVRHSRLVGRNLLSVTGLRKAQRAHQAELPLPAQSFDRIADAKGGSIRHASGKIHHACCGGQDLRGTPWRQGREELRRANHTIDIAKKAWTIVQRTHPQQFVPTNPFVGLTRFRSTSTIEHATRQRHLL